MNAVEPKNNSDNAGDPGAIPAASEPESPDREPRCGNWPEFYLQRLKRLIALDAELSSCATVEADREWKLDLVHRAIYASFCDCITLDVKDEAVELLKQTSGKN